MKRSFALISRTKGHQGKSLLAIESEPGQMSYFPLHPRNFNPQTIEKRIKHHSTEIELACTST